MATASNPITLSREYGIDEATLAAFGVLNPTIAIDTLLFIDPMLLKHSAHPEFSTDAQNQYEAHFETVIGLLRGSRSTDDPAWRAARKRMTFHEIPGTCLGYGAGSIRGRGFAGKLTERVLNVAKQIVDIGIEDPDLFAALALFEANIGPDRISDMTTNVIFRAICSFNDRILTSLELDGERFNYMGVSGRFLPNPYESESTPIVLLPEDILRDLPIAKSWDEIADAADKNEQLRTAVNEHIGEIFERKTLRDKSRLKRQSLSSPEAFEALLTSMRAVAPEPYDTEADPDGLTRWATKGLEFAQQYPLAFANKTIASLDDVFAIVMEIIKDFRHVVENRGLNKELYKEDGRPRREATAQRLFFAMAYAHCKANNVSISPEIDTGNGKIDFKFSTGFEQTVLVEIKLSTNSKTVAGYSAQLEIYKQAEQTSRAIYLVIDVGSMGKKQERLIDKRNAAAKRGEPLSELEFIDGLLKPPPSQRK